MCSVVDMVPTEKISVTTTSEIEKESTKLIATVWAAAAEAAKSCKLGSDGAVELLASFRRLLAKSNPSLFKVHVVKHPTLKRKRDAVEIKASVTPRSWQPRRPSFAKEIGSIVMQGVGLTEVPVGKQNSCVLPIKLFGRDVVGRVAKSEAATGYTNRSVQYAVTEVLSAIISEAEALREASDEKKGVFELHGSTDAAWAGTAARGCGIAMDEAGKALILAAAARVVDRLAQPALKLAKLPR